MSNERTSARVRSHGTGAASAKAALSSIPTRLILGFFAGSFSYLIFQGALGAALHAANLVPALPWSLIPVPPLGVPRSLSLGFWAGLWGIGYAALEPRLTAAFGRWLGGFAYGLAPLAGHWFVALPLKGLDVGGGFHLAKMPIEIAFHLTFGIGAAILLRAGLVLARPRVRAVPEALRA